MPSRRLNYKISQIGLRRFMNIHRSHNRADATSLGNNKGSVGAADATRDFAPV
jgi:hypothetical protein